MDGDLPRWPCAGGTSFALGPAYGYAYLLNDPSDQEVKEQFNASVPDAGRSCRVLRKGGVLVTLVSPIPADVAEQHGERGVFFIVSGNRRQLDQITGLVDMEKLKPVLSEVLPLARAREAFEHGAAGHAPGKIVLQVTA